MIKSIYLFLALALFIGAISIVYQFQYRTVPQVALPEGVTCTADALECPDGSLVGRTGPNCEFDCPQVVPVDTGTTNLIILDSPQPQAVVTTPLKLSGKARGSWFFEASFPVMLTNWDGEIIAEGPATAVGDWMTSEFVPFTMNLSFVSPYKAGDPDFMKRGTLILKKDNPSGMSEHDDSFEIQVQFAP